MGKIVCTRPALCSWPDCQCTYSESPVEQRKSSLPPGADRPRYDAPDSDSEPPSYLNATGKDIWRIGFNTARSLAAPAPAAAPVAPAPMYADSKHQKADPARMRAVLADQFGPIIGTPARRVIPIKAEQAPQLFDADIVEIMLRQAGAVTEGFYIVIKRRETLEKLAEALNNLGS